MHTARSLFALGLALTSACVVSPDEAIVDQDIHGPGAQLASQFQRDRAAAIHRCTATRISPNFLITAMHCKNAAEQWNVDFYGTGSAASTTLGATIDGPSAILHRPGVNAADCHDSICTDTSGLFADFALLRLVDVSPSMDGFSGAQATLAWRYPGEDVVGIAVGAGDHDDMANDTRILKQVADTTWDDDDDDGEFWTTEDDVNPADSGGPFYVQNRVLGIASSHGWDPTAWAFTQYTSVAKHLDWILSNIGYAWAGQTPRQNSSFAGTVIESFTATERVCQYACEHTQSCEAYNFHLTSCGLYKDLTGMSTQIGWRTALHYGASSGKSNEAAGYARNDGYSSVVHKATDGNIHELYRNGNQWFVGGIAPMASQPIAGKLSGYRRGDGINSILYRSTNNRIIEVALVPGVGWQASDLTNWGGSPAAGDPVGYVRHDGVSAVVYRGTDSRIIELRLGTNGWIATDLTLASGHPEIPAHSDPMAFVRADGFSSVVFRAGSTVQELFKQSGQQWAMGTPSALATPVQAGAGPAPAAQGRPYGYTRRKGTTAIVYRSTANQLIELRIEGGWKWQAITGGQALGGNPVAYVRPDGVDSIVYRSSTNQINELTRSIGQTTAQAWNLSAQYSVMPVTTDPSVYQRVDGDAAIVYGLANNRVGELSYSVAYGWGSTNLSFDTGEQP